MLFGSTLLEVAIGVIFVYLLLSLLCSAFSELIESVLRFRARDLRKGIGKLLSDPELAKDFFEHPLVEPLGTRPSYIPARTFSLALWSMASQGEMTRDMSEIKRAIGSLPDDKYAKIKASLFTLIDEAGNDIDKARANIEGWYNDAMDRVSGWYKRRTHWILVVMGLAAAIVLNVDSINVARALWFNDTLRRSVSEAADKYVQANPKPANAQNTETSTAKDEGDPEAQAKEALGKVKYVRGELIQLALPIGWVREPDQNDPMYNNDPEGVQYKKDREAYLTDPRRAPNSRSGWLFKILGLAFTALAISQGAPFWFDLLNKFMVIRSTVKPSEKSQAQPSKDRPAPETKQQPDETKK